MKFLIRLVFFALFCSPALSSKISHAINNNHKSKKFRAAVRREYYDLTHLNERGENYLHVCAKQNRAAQLRILLATPLKEWIGATNSKEQTPIEVAIQHGSVEAFLVLLKDYDINYAFDEDGWTFAHLAAWYDQPEILRALHSAGADMKAREKWFEDGQTPIEVAIIEGSFDAFLVLLEYYDLNHRFGERGWTFAHLAAWHNQPDMLWALHKAGAVMNARDKSQSQWRPFEAANLAGANEATVALLQMDLRSTPSATPSTSRSNSRSKFSFKFLEQ